MNFWNLLEPKLNAGQLQEFSKKEWNSFKSQQRLLRLGLLGPAYMLLVWLVFFQKHAGPQTLEAFTFMLCSSIVVHCTLLSILHNDMDSISKTHTLYEEVLTACALSPEAESHRKKVMLKRDLCRADVWAIKRMAVERFST